MLVAQHFAAQGLVRCVHRHVYGAYVQGDNALNLALGEIGERDVIAKKKAQTRVVIFKIHGFAHAARELVYKTENAVIGAGTRRVHQVAFKIQPQIAALGLAHGELMARAVRPFQHHGELRVIGKELIVEHVNYHIAVYGDKLIPRLCPPMQGA